MTMWLSLISNERLFEAFLELPESGQSRRAVVAVFGRQLAVCCCFAAQVEPCLCCAGLPRPVLAPPPPCAMASLYLEFRSALREVFVRFTVPEVLTNIQWNISVQKNIQVLVPATIICHDVTDPLNSDADECRG